MRGRRQIFGGRLLAAGLLMTTLLALPLGACSPEGGENGSAVGGETGGTTANEATAANAAPGAAPPADQGQGQGGTLLCSSQDALYYGSSSDGTLGVAADRLGGFTLYSAPESGSGRPGGGATLLLADCDPRISPGAPSYPTVRVDGAAYRAPEESALLQGTQKTEDGALLTSYGFVPGTTGGSSTAGVTLRRSLKIVETTRVQTGVAALQISYEIKNVSGASHVVGLRSLLAPRPSGSATPPSAPAGSPGAAEPLSQFVAPGVGGIPYERYLQDGALPDFFVAPRPGAPGYWAAGDAESSLAPPERIALGGLPELSKAPYEYSPRDYWPLPKNAAFASYWGDREIPPGGSIRYAEIYGPASEGLVEAAGPADKQRETVAVP